MKSPRAEPPFGAGALLVEKLAYKKTYKKRGPKGTTPDPLYVLTGSYLQPTPYLPLVNSSIVMANMGQRSAHMPHLMQASSS